MGYCRSICDDYGRVVVHSYHNLTLLLPPSRFHPVDQCTQVYLEKFGAPIGYGGFLPTNRSLPLSCNYTDPDNGGREFFPSSNLTYAIGGENVTVPCSERQRYQEAQLICQEPLVPDYDEDLCGFSCPIPSLTEEQYDSVKIMQGVVGWTSWVCSWTPSPPCPPLFTTTIHSLPLLSLHSLLSIHHY